MNKPQRKHDPQGQPGDHVISHSPRTQVLFLTNPLILHGGPADAQGPVNPKPLPENVLFSKEESFLGPSPLGHLTRLQPPSSPVLTRF